MPQMHAPAKGSIPSTQMIDAEQALMLDVLGQAPVMFHRAYVGVTGSINAALWLSYAMGRRAQALSAIQEGCPSPVAATTGPLWFSFSREECEDGTGLTRHQQDTARRELRQLGIVLEQRRLTTEVAIHTRKLGQLLMQQSRAQWGDRITPSVTLESVTSGQQQLDAGVLSKSDPA